MTWTIIAREAWEYFRQDALRTGLAASCITVATVVFVSIQSFAGELGGAVEGMLRGLGRDTLVITRDGVDLSTDEEKRARRRHRISAEDERFLAVHLRETSGLARRLVRSGVARADAPAGSREVHRVFLVQTDAVFADLIDLGIARGRFFTDFEAAEGRPVAVLGPSVADVLFPGESPLGREVALHGKLFRVIGVFESRGTLFGQDLDRWAALPFAAGPPLARGESPELVVGVGAGADALALQNEVTELLRFRRGLDGEAAGDFEVINQGNLLDLFAQLLRGSLTFSLLIGVIVLFAGGLSVMNTQLMAVNERIREIGVHRAVGATNYQILWLFLCESLLIVTAGGAAGLVLAELGAALADAFDLFHLEIAARLVVINWLAFALIGLFFGFYPALKAGRLTVVECLGR